MQLKITERVSSKDLWVDLDYPHIYESLDFNPNLLKGGKEIMPNRKAVKIPSHDPGYQPY
jgi:hypothetical protein